MKTIFPVFYLRNQLDTSVLHDLREWRTRVLEGILRGIFALWVFALIGGINNVLEAYRDEGYLYEDPLSMAASVISVYLATTAILAFITFNRKLKFELRAGLLLFIFYALGAIGLALSSFSGDGRIFFFGFIILAAVFFDLRYSLSAFILTILTLAVVGWLQVSGTLVVPAESQINSSDAGAWMSGGIVLLVISVAALISINYLLQALGRSLQETREALEHQQRLSLLLRTLSDVNQLIVREQDAAQILQQACEILIAGRGYIFSWISLLEADGITLKLASSAGEMIDSELFSAMLDGESNGPSCVRVALHSKQPFLVEPLENDPCPSCPLLKKYPHRSSLALPIIRETHIFGVLTVVHPAPSGAFDEEEINLLVELANDLAYALEKLESEQRIVTYARHQALLNGITQTALETPNLEIMLQKFVEGLETALDADEYYIALWDESSQSPAQFVGSDSLKDILSNTSAKIRSGDVIFSQSILDSGHALVIDDVMNTPYISPHVAALFPVRSALGLPLIANSQKLGALVFGFREAHQFTSDEIEFGEQAAGQIALAVLKALLDNATRARAAELGRLYAAAQDMASSIMDPPVLLNKLAHHMVEALDATSGSIMSVNRFEGNLTVLAQYWSEAANSLERRPDFGSVYENENYSTVMACLFEGNVITLQSDDEQLTNAERQQFVDFDIKSMLFVPIISHGKLIGDAEIWESRRRRDFTLAEIHLAQAMAGHAASIIETAQLFEVLEQREAYFRALIENSAEGVAILDAQGDVRYVAPAEKRLTGYDPEEVQGQSAFRYIHPQDLPELTKTFLEGVATPGAVRTLEYRLQRKDGEWRYFELTGHNMLDDPHISGVVTNYRDITERKQAEDALKASEMKFRALAENIPSVVYLCKNDERYTFVYLNDAIEDLTGYPKVEFLENELTFFDLYHPDDVVNIPELAAAQDSLTNQQSFHITYRIRHKSGEWRWVDEWGVGVMNDKGGVQYLEGAMIDITERKRTEENLRRRAHELEALASASAALRTAQNVTEMVPVLAKQALRAVGGNYGSIFLFDPENGDYVSHGWFSSRGESKNKLQDETVLRHHPGEGITGHVAITGEIYVTEDMQKDPVIFILDAEKKRLQNLHGGISLPLRAQEKIIGVMHIWMTERHIFSETEIRILIALSETAGNAIHRAMLFEQTLQHADELARAYDNTLAGWARALELRDEITEGHTRRVTELTLKLARAMNIPENEIVHIRRGALLHDIGKMGIPDSILHKPGAFTMQERIIMEQHTQYAFDMLLSISFLQPALDIPFCHHEHWDGNGYPRKLKGEQIPLSARIFSVVDVWDALTSDRPYRSAWSKEKTHKYIIERAGKQFDPRVVETFFSLELD